MEADVVGRVRLRLLLNVDHNQGDNCDGYDDNYDIYGNNDDGDGDDDNYDYDGGGNANDDNCDNVEMV